MSSLPLKTEEPTNQLAILIFSQEQLSSAGAILTLNRLDFKRLHSHVREHAGIIICTEDPDRLGQARRITEAITQAGDLRAKLIRVYRQE